MTRDTSHPAPPQETDPPPSAVPVQRHTTTVVADRFDLATWHDTRAQSTALRDLAAELSARHEGATDLLTDVFLAAYQARPRLHDPATVDPARLVNHHIVNSLIEPPEFTELRRTTAGDAYAAAMAVLAMSTMLRRILEHADEAQSEAEQARRAQLQAETAETARTATLQTKNRATEALTAAAPGMRAAAHAAAAQAATAARREAELLRAWGVDSAQTERLPFAERLRLAERLATSRLAQWADLIGRFRQMASGERASRPFSMVR